MPVTEQQACHTATNQRLSFHSILFRFSSRRRVTILRSLQRKEDIAARAGWIGGLFPMSGGETKSPEKESDLCGRQQGRVRWMDDLHPNNPLCRMRQVCGHQKLSTLSANMTTGDVCLVEYRTVAYRCDASPAPQQWTRRRPPLEAQCESRCHLGYENYCGAAALLWTGLRCMRWLKDILCDRALFSQ